MKKKYIAPATLMVYVKTEGLMQAGSFGNSGDKSTNTGEENWQTGVSENTNSDIGVDAKGTGDWDALWED